MRCLRLFSVLLLAMPALLSGQSIRGSLGGTARYVEIRPMAHDTVALADVATDQDGRMLYNGQTVICVAQTCTFYRPADVEHALASSQDLSVSMWGYGVEGLSSTVYLRSRQALAGEFTWPRSDDAFDAVLAYAELAREKYRVRAGRQRSLTGLGFYSFDGLTAIYSAADWVDVEAYGGRSLARALEQPRHEALAGVENFIPDDNAWLFGGAAQLRGSGMNASVRYQREIWGDRAALVSERASADFQSNLRGILNVEMAADYDVAYNQLGKAHITLRKSLLANRLTVSAGARRYMPFFELWTIWGVFSPVAYHEGEVQAGWRASDRIDLEARASIRKFNEADAAIFISPAEDRSYRFDVGGRMKVSEGLDIDASYILETGFGALLSSGEAAVSWSPGERLRVGAYATAFQQIFEFRLGEAAVLGVGGNFDVQVLPSISLNGNAALYHQKIDNRDTATDWNQKRAAIGIVWTFGRDPGTGATP